MKLPEYITAGEVAKTLRVRPQTIYKMARSGKLPSIKIGGRGRGELRFDVEKIAQWLREQS